MNYAKRTHIGGDYAKVEVYDEHGNVEEYEINKHLADAINNMHVTIRLDYLRRELRGERLSWGDVAELQSLAAYIDPWDTELREAAGIPE